jgi:hypothetical protein
MRRRSPPRSCSQRDGLRATVRSLRSRAGYSWRNLPACSRRSSTGSSRSSGVSDRHAARSASACDLWSVTVRRSNDRFSSAITRACLDSSLHVPIGRAAVATSACSFEQETHTSTRSKSCPPSGPARLSSRYQQSSDSDRCLPGSPPAGRKPVAVHRWIRKTGVSDAGGTPRRPCAAKPHQVAATQFSTWRPASLRNSRSLLVTSTAASAKA